jgi:hypothetical protein
VGTVTAAMIERTTRVTSSSARVRPRIRGMDQR